MRSEEEGIRLSLPPPSSASDPETWKVYWKSQGQLWRMEPEITNERQKELTERRSILPDIEKGIYPFKDIEPKLTRADIEWLLTTHQNGQGPVDWRDWHQHEREGLDLRGTDLRGADLHNLPLARMQGSLTWSELSAATEQQRVMAVIRLEGANLWRAHLEGADLIEAHLENANLGGAHLEDAYLLRAHLENSDLRGVYLERARLEQVALGNEKRVGPRLVEARWGNVNLAVVQWSQVKMLADEYEAQQKKREGKVKDRVTRLAEYEQAIRANRQLAVVLQTQGLNEIAAYFAYRAQKLQGIVFRRRRKFGSYLFFAFLDLLAGYGYRPGRSILWYLAIIFGFAIAYSAFGHLPLLPDSLVFSLTSFHGRGFFPGLEYRTSLHDPLVMLAALEAVIGLFVEISFIATFTQRFFGK